MQVKEKRATKRRDVNLASAPHEQLVEVDCACGLQLDRSPDEVVWCVVDIARHYRRSTRWAYRAVMQDGFPKPTRGDSHRWYKSSILDWDRGESVSVSLVPNVEPERLTPHSVTLNVSGRTVRPSRRAGATR
jgi:hypothetical protein